MRRALLPLLLLLAGVSLAGEPPAEVILPGLVDVGAALPDVKVELRYATADNFMKRDVYGGLKKCFLQKEAADKLAAARTLLQKEHPTWTFLMYDCARPRSVQLIMWDVVKGTPQQGYVANPLKPPGSVHNLGCAVDLGVFDTASGSAVDMGTPHDFFGKKAEPRHEQELLKKGELTAVQVQNREALRKAMLGAGWGMLQHEWWHFDCLKGSEARKKFPVIE